MILINPRRAALEKWPSPQSDRAKIEWIGKKPGGRPASQMLSRCGNLPSSRNLQKKCYTPNAESKGLRCETDDSTSNAARCTSVSPLRKGTTSGVLVERRTLALVVVGTKLTITAGTDGPARDRGEYQVGFFFFFFVFFFFVVLIAGREETHAGDGQESWRTGYGQGTRHEWPRANPEKRLVFLCIDLADSFRGKPRATNP